MSRRSIRNNRKPKEGGPSKSSKQMLAILNLMGKAMYQGTVSTKDKAKRRARNKRARISRRLNRNG
jgi:hypothetical protein